MPVDGKPVRPRLAARNDVEAEAAIRYYRREAALKIALRFIAVWRLLHSKRDIPASLIGS